jgi:hypothetical protein
MDKRGFAIDAVGIGLALWLAGYLSSIFLFFLVPREALGWILFGTFAPITAYVAYRRFHKQSRKFVYYLWVAVFWTVIAMVSDYFFIVRLFSSVDYYKTDVYLYYITTFLIPLGMGFKYSKKA